MCGYASHQDPRLQPRDDGREPASYFLECVHSGACKMTYERVAWSGMRVEALARVLRCGDGCRYYDTEVQA